ncbi:hypothetical protein KGY64_08040 [Candidatus Bipolaricaulota bacterium]|nr:hypothetical protein [Candidatus Bipolaricaulota bacterium]MBS3793013.1 hypothetical protein [Candidatus Bipolaricaulota bacterium]MBS3813749.1 hypothetical protein [Candidatus Bipolaricaulota bacterium]
MSTFKKSALIAGSLLLVFSLIFLAGGPLALAKENDFDELDTLSLKIEGTMYDEPAKFHYRIKDIGTEDEAFRLDATSFESEKSMGFIINHADDSSFYKEWGTGSWMAAPFLMVRPYWEKYSKRHIAIAGAKEWRSWAEAEQEEFIIEGEEYSTRVWDIEVDEPIEDSVFSPNS